MLLVRQIKALIPDRHPLRLAWHNAKALVAALCYGFPARKLTVIGITGTDGKTTTVGMIAHILHERGIAVGALTSAAVRVRGTIEPNPSQKTSPSPFVIQRFLQRLVREGCTHAVVEYSSHGLVQGRLDWTWPRIAGITNTAEEHLDYHGSMEQYRADKGILFRMLRGHGTKVLNADDATARVYESIPSDTTVFYSPKHDLVDIRSEPSGCSARANISGTEIDVRLRIPGAFNLENALCAIDCATAVGIALQDAVSAIGTFPGTVGRMERIDEEQPFSVFVDFAITPQAMEKTLTTIRAMVGSDHRVLVLTGSCGDRMKEKRPVIGQLCSQLADVTVITDDESYTEDPAAIIDDIWNGIDTTKTDAHRIPDRREAIGFILRAAKPGDAVVLCGLGSYASRMTLNGPIPWNEQEIVRNMLKDRRWKT